MLSNLLINQQKFVLFVDNVGMERFSDKLISELLKEQGQNKFENVPSKLDYCLDGPSKELTNELNNLREETNVILRPLSTLLNVYKLQSVFRSINKLRKDSHVKQSFLWATTRNLSDHIAVPFLEYLADVIVTIADATHLSVVTRKQGGAVTNKLYEFQIGGGSFQVKEIKKAIQKPAAPEVKHDTTFKIELEEDELIARNAVELPYERVSQAAQKGQIIYTPDANDDFDEEDPDDDLDF